MTKATRKRLGERGAPVSASNADAETHRGDDTQFQQRIETLVAVAGNANALAVRSGLTRPAVEKYLRGGDVSRPVLIALARAAGVRVEWLATGEGPMRAGESPPAPGTAPEDDRYVRIPRYEVQAAAGAGVVVDQERIRELVQFDASYLRVQLGVDPAHLALIEAVGDSMAPSIASGDLLLVDVRAGPQLRGEGVYVLAIDDTLLVKRLSVRPGGRIVISSDNKAYPSEEIDRRDLGERLRIIGRVVWVGGPV